MPEVLVPAVRWSRWVVNFEARHGATALRTASGGVRGDATDGSWFTARLPFDHEYDAAADPDALLAAISAPADWGVLLVRKGGFAIARLAGGQVTDSKVGRRHVQGRTKAGGQSQQRFARRRQKQAREAFEAAADHAARILDGCPTVVTGGDHTAVEEVLADPRLATSRVVGPWLAVPDPRRAVLEAAIDDAQAIRVEVVNADG